MGTHITDIRSDLIELRLKLLGCTGSTMVERARSLQDTLGRSCIARIRTIAAICDRYAWQPATQPMDRVERRLFLEDCEIVDRRLHKLLEESKRHRVTESGTRDACRNEFRQRDSQDGGEPQALTPRQSLAITMRGAGLGEYVGPEYEPSE